MATAVNGGVHICINTESEKEAVRSVGIQDGNGRVEAGDGYAYQITAAGTEPIR